MKKLYTQRMFDEGKCFVWEKENSLSSDVSATVESQKQKTENPEEKQKKIVEALSALIEKNPRFLNVTDRENHFNKLVSSLSSQQIADIVGLTPDIAERPIDQLSHEECLSIVRTHMGDEVDKIINKGKEEKEKEKEKQSKEKSLNDVQPSILNYKLAERVTINSLGAITGTKDSSLAEVMSTLPENITGKDETASETLPEVTLDTENTLGYGIINKDTKEKGEIDWVTKDLKEANVFKNSINKETVLGLLNATEAQVNWKTKNGGMPQHSPRYVLAVQAALKMINRDPGKIDALWGTNTQKSLAAFQRDNGLEVNGVPNKETIVALAKALGETKKETADTSKDTGTEIKDKEELTKEQIALKNQNNADFIQSKEFNLINDLFKKGSPAFDKLKNAKTNEEKVRVVQDELDIKVDGWAGTNTMNALKDYLTNNGAYEYGKTEKENVHEGDFTLDGTAQKLPDRIKGHLVVNSLEGVDLSHTLLEGPVILKGVSEEQFQEQYKYVTINGVGVFTKKEQPKENTPFSVGKKESPLTVQGESPLHSNDLNFGQNADLKNMQKEQDKKPFQGEEKTRTNEQNESEMHEKALNTEKDSPVVENTDSSKENVTEELSEAARNVLDYDKFDLPAIPKRYDEQMVKNAHNEFKTTITNLRNISIEKNQLENDASIIQEEIDAYEQFKTDLENNNLGKYELVMNTYDFTNTTVESDNDAIEKEKITPKEEVEKAIEELIEKEIKSETPDIKLSKLDLNKVNPKYDKSKIEAQAKKLKQEIEDQQEMTDENGNPLQPKLLADRKTFYNKFIKNAEHGTLDDIMHGFDFLPDEDPVTPEYSGNLLKKERDLTELGLEGKDAEDFDKYLIHIAEGANTDKTTQKLWNSLVNEKKGYYYTMLQTKIQGGKNKLKLREWIDENLKPIEQDDTQKDIETKDPPPKLTEEILKANLMNENDYSELLDYDFGTLTINEKYNNNEDKKAIEKINPYYKQQIIDNKTELTQVIKEFNTKMEEFNKQTFLLEQRKIDLTSQIKELEETPDDEDFFSTANTEKRDKLWELKTDLNKIDFDISVNKNHKPSMSRFDLGKTILKRNLDSYDAFKDDLKNGNLGLIKAHSSRNGQITFSFEHDFQKTPKNETQKKADVKDKIESTPPVKKFEMSDISKTGKMPEMTKDSKALPQEAMDAFNNDVIKGIVDISKETGNWDDWNALANKQGFVYESLKEVSQDDTALDQWIDKNLQPMQ